MANVLFGFWVLVNLLLFVHVFHEFILMLLALRPHKIENNRELKELPFVTIQLPLFNEKYVVKRLLEAVSKLDYPKDKLEIQILDDSTDETSDLIGDFLKENEEGGYEFIHIQRDDRSGYKAGALAYGTERCRGEFIAIFDADFVPDQKFLMQTIPHFQDAGVGVVQTRWLHINEGHSVLTRAQALMLNTHFSVEHLGRKNANGFINFNGTAGVWRKECILSSGGWQADTLTEDLDLSFRAQIKGWKFEYLFDVGSPAELPLTFDSYRTQQFRWSKGAAECLRKNIRSLWRSGAATSAKLVGTFHLLNSSVYLLAVLVLLLSPAVFYLTQAEEITLPYHAPLTMLGVSVLYLLMLVFFVGHWKSSANKVKAVLLFIPSVLIYFVMTTGISIYMVRGVIEGYRGKHSAFVRTPKFGSTVSLLRRIREGYDFKNEGRLLLLEVLGFCYGVFWVTVAIVELNPACFLYGSILLMGFSLSLFFKYKTFSWQA
ncbi:MAG: glycosyltransferase [Roseivirga sp.]|nr:glycosyltransferase [Roseivirga sp.]